MSGVRRSSVVEVKALITGVDYDPSCVYKSFGEG